MERHLRRCTYQVLVVSSELTDDEIKEKVIEEIRSGAVSHVVNPETIEDNPREEFLEVKEITVMKGKPDVSHNYETLHF